MHYFFSFSYNIFNEIKVIYINKKELDSTKLNSLINRTNKLVKILYLLLIASIILAILYVCKETRLFDFIIEIIKVLSPVFVGFIFAFLLYPLVNMLKKKNLSNTLSCIIVYIFLIVIIFIFFKIFIPVLYHQLNNFIEKLPDFLNDLKEIFEKLTYKFSNKNINYENFKENLFNNISLYFKEITNKMPKHIINFTKSFFSAVCMILTGFVVGLYMLLDFEKIYNKITNVIPEKYCSDCKNLINKIAMEVRKTINGTFLVALMVLVCDTILFTVFGLDSPLLFGIICGLTDLIPYVGPYIGGGIATIVGFTQSSKIGVAVLISCFIVQLIENNILQPIVMSKTTKLHPIIIIMGLLIFGHFFGIIGMILSTPIITLIKCIFEYFKEKSSPVNLHL